MVVAGLMIAAVLLVSIVASLMRNGPTIQPIIPTSPAIAVIKPDVTSSPREPTPVPANPTPTSIPSTPAIDRLQTLYAQGDAAYKANNWELAVTSLQEVFNYDPSFKDTQEFLSRAYYNWGVVFLRDQRDIDNALDKFKRTIEISPTHIEALKKRMQIAIYRDADHAFQKQDWETAITKLTSIDDPRGEFPGHLDLLAQARITYGQQLVDDGRYDDAMRLFADVQQMDVASHFRNQARTLASLAATLKPAETATPELQPTSARTPSSVPVLVKKLRFRKLNENERPGCISINITEIKTIGWYQ